MQNFEQTNSEIRELTDAELEAIAAGSFWGTVVHVLHTIFGGPGDHRRPTDRPN
jgi:hypothetical protein